VMADDGESFWINPWGLWWSEVKASDVCRADFAGQVVEGRWDIANSLNIHTELHKSRADARVIIHNHPYYVTVLAALGVLPEILHQSGCLVAGELTFVDEYSGEVGTADAGAHLADAVGDATVVILANHGILVTAQNLETATYKSVTIERQCRLAVDVLNLGRPYQVVPADVAATMKSVMTEKMDLASVYWNGAVRELLRSEPTILE
jgi:ribulose-5-phosphate 4-epimerase/fuculose-1-phosphate aldolase